MMAAAESADVQTEVPIGDLAVTCHIRAWFAIELTKFDDHGCVRQSLNSSSIRARASGSMSRSRSVPIALMVWRI